jgi:hypothetical protein
MSENIGVSYRFESEESFLKHIRDLCAGCMDCGSIDLKKHMTEAGSDFQHRTQYVCSDCMHE